MSSSRSPIGAVLILLVAAAQAPDTLAQSMPAAGMVENPCPPAALLLPEFDALIDSMLKPEKTNPEVVAKLSGPAAEAYAKAQNEQRARDWANLCRYRAENAALRAGSVRVVFLGDSITEFWRPADRGFFGSGIVNRGISGQTSPQMLLRFYADVIELHPKAVHILSGTNDLAGNTGPTSVQDFKNNIMAMTDIAISRGVKVILGSIPPCGSFPWAPQLMPARRIIELNSWLKRYAAERKLIYVDYHTALATADGSLRADLSHDGVHPHRGGYAIMKPLAEQAIAQALK
jgi:lysophospholipase L1-like esterase